MSKKLEGDGRWESSQMTLLEHSEQYWARRRRAAAGGQAQAPALTTEEINLIRDYALLPIMVSVVEKNRLEIELSVYSMKPLYLTASDLLLKRMLEDWHKVRKTLREHDIQVVEESKVDNAVCYRLRCRGYENGFELMRDVVRAEISLRLARYIADLFKAAQ